MRRFGIVLGDMALGMEARSARVTRANIDLVYGGRDARWRRSLVRQSIHHTAMTLVEAVALWTWPLPRLRALLQDVQGEERLRQAGTGTLIIIPHYGNWEYLGYYLNIAATLTPLYQRPGSPSLDAALRAARDRLGNRSAAGSIGGLRHVVKALRSGGLVAILPDQVPASNAGVVAPCFGRPTLTMSLVAKLLQKVEAVVVIATATRVDGGFAIRVEAVDDAVRDPDAATSAGAMNAAIETVVARHPAQYQWEYKRFRRESPEIYT